MTTMPNVRVAVVTGASSGIGLVAAKALAAAGWRVIGVGRNAERSAAALDGYAPWPVGEKLRCSAPTSH